MSDLVIDQFLLPGRLSTFTCFSKLPFELQLQIWESAEPDPAVISIRKANQKVFQTCNDRHRLVDIMKAQAVYQAPAMLHTCRASRAIALPKYRLSFKEHLDRPIYFDRSKDILFMEDCEALASFLRTPWFADLEVNLNDRFRFLAIAGSWLSYQDRLMGRLHLFRGVEMMFFEKLGDDKVETMNNFRRALNRRWFQYRTYRIQVLGESSGWDEVPFPVVRFIEPGELRTMSLGTISSQKLQVT